MTNAQHTPGPWKVKEYPNLTTLKQDIDVEDGKGKDIAIMCSSKADARLIAAASALLEALEGITTIYEQTGPSPTAWTIAARAAIAKAGR